MKFSKLKDESGSAMLLAIFLVVLVSIVIVSFSTQIGNQMKSTMRADESIQEKYKMESYIEEAIANTINSINIIKKDDTGYDLVYEKPLDIEEAKKDIMSFTVSEEKSENNIILKLYVTEMNEVKSNININISNIAGSNGKETCNINYEVKSWRTK